MARKSKTLPPGWKGTAHHPATTQQIRTIHTLKGELRMDDEPYRDVIARHGLGVVSSKDLTRAQASAVIVEMMGKLHGGALKPTSTPRRPGRKSNKRAPTKPKPEPITTHGNVIALATPPQHALIGHLIAEVNWYAHGSYADWLKANMRLDKIVTKEEASRVIEGLKGLKRHGHASNA
jgi:hypothetical protein